MGEQRQAVTYFQFQGGLNTDSSLLAVPPADSTDLSNVTLEVNGTVKRRKGIDFLGPKHSDGLYYETSLTNCTDDSDVNIYQDIATSVAIFPIALADASTLTVAVAHVGKYLYLWNYENLSALQNTDDYVATFDIPEIQTRGYHTKTKFIIDSNRLYLLNPFFPLCYIYYNLDEEEFVFKMEHIKYRDLEGNPDTDNFVHHNDKLWKCIQTHPRVGSLEPGVGDLWETSWALVGVEDTTDTIIPNWSTSGGDAYVSIDYGVGFIGSHSYYNYSCRANHTSSSSNKPSGKDDSTYWEFISITSEPIYDEWADAKVYEQASSAHLYTSNIENVQWSGSAGAATGWGGGCFAAGRLWLANHPVYRNRVYFSQTVIKGNEYNRMYQFADPYNPDDSAVVDTDGGYIAITGAEEIRDIVSFRSGVLVFASNGVWFIGGDTGIFRATDYSIEKISDDGIVGRGCAVDVDDYVVYFGYGNIYAIQLETVSLSPTSTAIGDKIKSFWTSIPIYQRQASKAIYNHDTAELYLITNFEEQDWFSTNNPYKENVRSRSILVFNTKIKAWYKYKLAEDTDASLIAIGDIFIAPGGKDGTLTVQDGSGNFVVDGTGALVTIVDFSVANYQNITALFLIKTNGNYTDFSFGELYGNYYSDFTSNAVDKESNASYIEIAPQVFNDIGHRKQVPYLYTAFNTVETGYNTSTETYENPGACNYRVSWDWASSNAAAKYGTSASAKSAYNPTKWNLVYEDGSLTGYEVVYGKHRLRGSGRAIQIRFESSGDLDFHLLGWQLSITGNPRD